MARIDKVENIPHLLKEIGWIEVVLKVSQPDVMKALIGDNRHFELYLKPYWKSMKLVYQKCNMDELRNTHNCPHCCILDQFQLLNALQWQSHVQHIAIAH